MKSFVIHELEKIKLNENLNIKNGFKYKLKLNSLGVKEIIILDPMIIDGLILSNFNKHYKKILEFYFSVLADDENSSDSGFMIALDEIARLRSILIRKYNLVVSKKKNEKMLKKLKILENEIRIKLNEIAIIKKEQMEHNINELNTGKSR